MKGFKIIFNGEKINISAEYELLIFHIIQLALNENATVCLYGVDYKRQIRKFWLNETPFKSGDVIELKVCDINSETVPTKEIAMKNIQRSALESKLKGFYELENYLKKKGLL